MEMKFQNLTADNAFDFCAVLDAVGVNTVIGVFDKDEINAMRNKEDMKKIGIVLAMKAVGALMKHMSSAREEIYAFLAGCTVWETGRETTREDFRNMRISEFAKLLKEFAKKEDLQDFLAEVLEFADTEQTNSGNSATDDTTIPATISAEQSEPEDSKEPSPQF